MRRGGTPEEQLLAIFDALTADDARDPVRKPDLVQEDQGDCVSGIGSVQVCFADRVKFRHVLQSGANGRA